MAEGQRPDGQHTCGVWPKARLLCGTQVTRGRIDGGVGQLEAVGIRPYYQAAGRILSKKTLDRIVMAKGRRPDGQPMCGVWPKAKLTCAVPKSRELG